MSRLETVLGDAVFSVDIDFQKRWPSNKWRDTTHFHVDREIHVIHKGDAFIEIGGKEVRVRAGDICLLAPRSSHYPKSCSDILEKTNFSFNLTLGFSNNRRERSFSEYLYYSSIFNSVSDYFVINDNELLSIVQGLFAEQYSDESEHVYRALLAVFFITLARRIKEHHAFCKEQAVRGVSESENSTRQRKIVEEFFQTRYNEEIVIEDLANALCLSVPHTHRIVKKVFEVGFKKILMKQRIEHACMLIKEENLPLYEIAYRSGYTSYNGFLSAFKGYMGKTPKEYEKLIRSESKR